MTIYQRIRQLRKTLGLSQQELAELTGYTSRTTIAKIEKGEVDISESKIIAFAKALETTPAHLMGWEEKDNSSAFETDEYKKFVEVFDKLTPENQKMIYNLAFLQAQQQNEEDKK